MVLNRLSLVAAACLGLVLGVPAPDKALAQERIAAIINDDVVSRWDLNERLKLALLTSNQPNTTETRRRIAPQVLRGVIDETLQIQEAQRLDLSASDGELERSLNDIAARNGMTMIQLNSFLASNNVAPQALRDQVMAQVAWLKIVRSRISPRVVVTKDQVSLILDQQLAEASEPQLNLSEIVLPVYSPDQEAGVLDNAREIVESLRNQADFKALAQQISVGTTAGSGGELGWVSLTSLSDLFRDMLASLPTGSVSEPVRSPQGVHIFKIDERRSSADAAAQSNQVSLAQMFFEMADPDSVSDAQAAAARAVSLSSRLNDCGDFERLATGDGDAGSGLLGWLDPADLPPVLSRAVAELERGELSGPVTGPSGVHLLMVCDVRQGNEDDVALRDQIRQRLQNEQVERLANRYLRDLRLDAFIDVRL